MRISAVIACYRDAPAVPIMYERLVAAIEGELGAEPEIIFVNDGSPDNAADVLAELAARDRRVVVINHARAFGSQSAFTSGMRVATGDAIVLLDGDLQDPPELIPQLVAKWREGYDVVYGERVQREAPWVMQRAYKLFYRVFAKLAYVNIPLDAGDFGLLDRRVVAALDSMPESHRFIRGLRAWVGFKQVAVPYVRPDRVFGRTTNSFMRNLGWARRAVVSFSYKPLEAITWLALATVLLAFAGAAYQIVARLVDPGAVPSGLSTIIVIVLFLGGIQLMCLSVIGWYLAHMYEEVKRRPPFIVESILNDPRAGETAAVEASVADRRT